MAKITLIRVQRKLERVKWDNYLRDFQDKRPQILDTYWHCVAADLLNNDIKNSKRALEKFNLLFFSSFSNCFYFSAKLLHKLLEAFDGYSYYYRREKEESEWNELENKYRRQMQRKLNALAQAVRSHYQNDEGITVRKKMVIKDLGAFDHFHKKHGLPISQFIVSHLRYAVCERDFVIPINKNHGCKFDFLVEHSLTESLQEIGYNYLKAAMKFFAMLRVTAELDKPTRRFEACPALKTTQAVKHFHQRYPHLMKRPLEEKAQLIRMCYRNPDGDKLKLDSIKKSLKRMKNHSDR